MHENKRSDRRKPNVVEVLEVGLADYKKVWRMQEHYFNKLLHAKLQRRSHGDQNPPHHYLILCEHPHVFTLGRNGDTKHLLISEQVMQERNISYYHIDRGGDITYHGPGQLVAYPILDLDYFFTDIGRYLRMLEQIVIDILADLNITAGRLTKQTGVWLEPESPSRARKICAIGIRCSRWITMHGLAFNVNTDLSYFEYIIPCGIRNMGVTSIQKEWNRSANFQQVQQLFLHHFARLFGCQLLTNVTPTVEKYA